jgi:hypothetical protein
VNLNRFLCPDIACNVPSNPSPLDQLWHTLDAGDTFDFDADAISDLYATCPPDVSASGATCKSSAIGSPAPAEVGIGATTHSTIQISLALTAQRITKHSWRISLRLRDGGRATVVVRCRRGHKQVTVLTRRISGTRAIRATVHCDSRPQGTAKPQ